MGLKYKVLESIPKGQNIEVVSTYSALNVEFLDEVESIGTLRLIVIWCELVLIPPDLVAAPIIQEYQEPSLEEPIDYQFIVIHENHPILLDNCKRKLSGENTDRLKIMFSRDNTGAQDYIRKRRQRFINA